MHTNLNVVYDDIIFRLQKTGGISKVFKNLFYFISRTEGLKVSILASHKSLVFKSISLNCLNEIAIPATIQQFLPILKKIPERSIYHSTYLRYSVQKNIIKVLTIHDCGYENGIMQKGIKRIIHLFFKRLVLTKADAIICVSENTKNDLLRFYPSLLKNKPISVIYNGVDDIYFSTSNITNKTNKIKYVLYVGSRVPYKNFINLIKSFKYLDDYEFHFVGAGPLKMEHKKLLEIYVNGRFKYWQDLPEEDLVNLYKNAFCLVYPSSYEGFGLPIIEAMAAGCPVIACNNSSIPEIAGDAAILIDSPNPKIIANSILKLNDIKFKDSLILKGKYRASQFTWENTALNTIKFYNYLNRSI